MKNNKLPHRLKKLRETNGYLQKAVASRLGIKSNTLSGYENGTRSPDPEMIVELANFYNVSTDYLLGKNEDEYTNENDLFNYYKEKIATEFSDVDLMFKDMASLTGEDLKEIYEYIKFKKSQHD